MAELKAGAVLFGEVESLAAARSGATFVDGWSGIKFGTKEMPSFYYENYHGLGSYSNMGPSLGYDASHNAPWMDAHRAAYRNAMEETGGSMLVPYEAGETAASRWATATKWAKFALGAKAAFSLATSAPVPGSELNWLKAQQQFSRGQHFAGIESLANPTSPTLGEVQGWFNEPHQFQGKPGGGRKHPPEATTAIRDELKSRHAVSHHTFNSLNHDHHTFSAMPRQLLPNKKTVTHKWSAPGGRLELPAGVGDIEIDRIKLNSLIDIGANLNTANTHEPMGYTQMSAMYEKYYVKEARVIIDYFNEEDSGQTTYAGIVLGCTPKDDLTALTTLGHYEELPGSQWRVVAPEGTGRMTYTITPNRFFGVSDKNVNANDKLVADTTADPTDLLYLHVWAHRLNEANADNVSVRFMTTMELDVVWMEPKALAQS